MHFTAFTAFVNKGKISYRCIKMHKKMRNLKKKKKKKLFCQNLYTIFYKKVFITNYILNIYMCVSYIYIYSFSRCFCSKQLKREGS